MVTLLPMGERAVLVEVGGLDEMLSLRAGLEASRPDGVVDIVPAARTVLVRVDPQVLSLDRARAWIRGQEEADATADPAAPSLVELSVRYDGPDLAVVAELLGLGRGELVGAHLAARWTVAFTGFAPGFGYLVSADWPFEVARLDSPRTRVPAGAVGLAAGFTGAYPNDTPGGWQLIGTTDAVLFDADAASPALLTPGTSVRFRKPPASSAVRLPGAPVPSRGPGVAGGEAPVARVVEPGLLAAIQDLGRPGHAALGVAPSGAADRRALRTANRLVGNPEGAAAVEVTMGGFRAVAESDSWFAVTGAWGPIRLGGAEVDPYEAHAWPTGVELHLDWFSHGARAYLAVRGGVGGRLSLGSRSTDRLAGLGPSPLRAGDALIAAAEAVGPIPVAEVSPWRAPHDDELEVALTPGPRADWFTAPGVLFESVWTVTNDADRVGIRLDGPQLYRARSDELRSEGMVPGALQVPPSGRPTILLADGPVTGGYPVIAVATDASLDALAQARPGTHIRFHHARPL